MAKDNRNTLEQTVGDIKQEYTARVEAPNQFVPKQGARVARTRDIGRDIGMLLGNTGAVVRDQTRITDEAVKRHALEQLTNQTVKYMELDQGLMPTDDRHDVMSKASGYLSAAMGNNTYDDPHKQEIFDKYFTLPAKEQLERTYTKWSKEQNIIDDRVVEQQELQELRISQHPSNMLSPEDKRNHREEVVGRMARRGKDVGFAYMRLAKDNIASFDEAYSNMGEEDFTQLLDTQGNIIKDKVGEAWNKFYGSYGEYSPETGQIEFVEKDPAIQEALTGSFEKFFASAKKASNSRKSERMKFLKDFAEAKMWTGKESQSYATIGDSTYKKEYVQDNEERAAMIGEAAKMLGFVPGSDESNEFLVWYKGKVDALNPNGKTMAIMANTPIGMDMGTPNLDDKSAKTVYDSRAQQVGAEMQDIFRQVQEEIQSPKGITRDTYMRQAAVMKEYTSGINSPSNVKLTSDVASNLMKTMGTMQGYNYYKNMKTMIDTPSFKSYLAASGMDQSDQKFLSALLDEYRLYDAKSPEMQQKEPLNLTDKFDDMRRVAKGQFNSNDIKYQKRRDKEYREFDEKYSWMPEEDKNLAMTDVKHALSSKEQMEFVTEPGSAVANLYISKFETPFGEPFRIRKNEQAMAKGGDPLVAKMNRTTMVDGEPKNLYAENMSEFVFQSAKKSGRVSPEILEYMQDYGYTIRPVMQGSMQKKKKGAKSNDVGYYEVYYNDSLGKAKRIGWELDMSLYPEDGKIPAELKD